MRETCEQIVIKFVDLVAPLQRCLAEDEQSRNERRVPLSLHSFSVSFSLVKQASPLFFAPSPLPAAWRRTKIAKLCPVRPRPSVGRVKSRLS